MRRLVCPGYPVEDQVKPEFILVGKGVARLSGVFYRHLGEVRVFVGGKLSKIVCATSTSSSEVSNGRLVSCSANP
jgi:hypothetical protein